jgi:nicotinamidase/pyrazinamidase
MTDRTITDQYGPQTGLIVIDVQNDFAAPGGSLYVDGGETIVPAINSEIERAEVGGATVVYTQDWHPETTSHFTTSGGVWPPHCVRDTTGAAFHPRLRVAGTVVRKGTGGEDGYSGFTVRDPLSDMPHATELGRILSERGVQKIVVVGLAGDYCVKATALDGRDLGFDVTVPLRLTRFVMLAPGDDERSVAEMRSAGVDVVT